MSETSVLQYRASQHLYRERVSYHFQQLSSSPVILLPPSPWPSAAHSFHHRTDGNSLLSTTLTLFDADDLSSTWYSSTKRHNWRIQNAGNQTKSFSTTRHCHELVDDWCLYVLPVQWRQTLRLAPVIRVAPAHLDKGRKDVHNSRYLNQPRDTKPNPSAKNFSIRILWTWVGFLRRLKFQPFTLQAPVVFSPSRFTVIKKID